jgi:DNA-directed RNA polymerase subunit RPC12/RpoP
MRGYVRCERCDWSRIYATFSVARIPMFCPACGRRVVREREPTPNSHAIARWKAVADQLGHHPREQPPQ